MDLAERNRSLRDVATRLRIESVRSTSAVGSGHPTSAASAADLVAALFFGEMRLDVDNPRNPKADRFILSKGHAAPVLYAAWSELGKIPVAELQRLRSIDSDLEGHPMPQRLDFVDVATGSLGQGLSVGVGMALAQAADGYGARTFVLCGDGEVAEGAIWEAAALAGHLGIANLVCIVDANGLGQSEPTMYAHDPDSIADRFAAFGWRAEVIDGHDYTSISAGLDAARTETGRPTVLLANTVKGKDFPGIEDAPGWHGKPLPEDRAAEVIAYLEGQLAGAPKPAPSTAPAGTLPQRHAAKLEHIGYDLGAEIATRKAFGDALAGLGNVEPAIVALDGDTQNSTYTETFHAEHPDRFVQCYIAEQNMVGVAAGFAALGRIPFAATFAAFLTRAFDQIRMLGLSQADIKLVGSHAGISIGEDGPSQMGLEDLAMFRTVPGCVALYPSDAVSAARATELAANHRGMVYIRTTRPTTEVIYSADECFEIGKAKVVRRSDRDRATVVAGGVTLFEALAAADALERADTPVRVVDVFSIEPLDSELLLSCVRETDGPVVTVEDHYVAGGIGDAVLAALSPEGVRVEKLAVTGIPRSGKPGELLDRHGISRKQIVETIERLLR